MLCPMLEVFVPMGCGGGESLTAGGVFYGGGRSEYNRVLAFYLNNYKKGDINTASKDS